MGKPIHPDRLDAVSAAQDSSARHQAGDEQPASQEEVKTVLNKVLAQQSSSKLPRKRRPRAIVLASISLLMERYRAYTESELTHLLQPWLVASGLSLDHAACRRYLIDHGFVRRDRAGQRYIADYARIEALLSPDALSSAKEQILRTD